MSTEATPVDAPGAHMLDERATYDQRAFGFWLYLMSDAVIFALLFATYAVMVGNTANGPVGNALFSLPNAAVETALLLTSTLTFGMASLALRAGDKTRLLSWLLVTLVLGVSFLVLEVREFIGMMNVGAGPQRSGFLSAFFTLVGTHGLHVTFGSLWIVILSAQVMVKGLTAPVSSRLFRLSLFWHFLDIVWIGIFSIVYLPGIL